MMSTNGTTMRRETFGSLSKGGLKWDRLPMRLFVKGNARFWNPADIDFSQDAEDWKTLTPAERQFATDLATAFLAGEEAVTQDIQPFIQAVSKEGRVEDELYLTQFCFEEAKHVETFRRWFDAIGEFDDLHDYTHENKGYEYIFYDALPEALRALQDDPSPAAQIRASVVYNQVVEGTLALTGYHAWASVCSSRNILPGMQQLVKLIGDDERRHMAWGTYTCRRHVADDDANWTVVEESLDELLQPALSVITGLFDKFEEGEVPFGMVPEDFTDYALDRFSRRVGAIESARGKTSAEIDGGTYEEDLEDAFADEEAAEKEELQPA